MKMFAPFLSVLGRPPQACSLSLSGLSLGLILLFMPEMWVIIWQLLFLNLSLTCRESNLKTKHHIKGIEVILYPSEYPSNLLNVFLSCLSLSFQENIPFPVTNKLYFLSLPPRIVLWVFGGFDFHQKRKDLISPVLPESAGSCWEAGVGTTADTRGRDSMSVPPVGWSVVSSPNVVTKTKDAPLSSLKLLGIVFCSGTHSRIFWCICGFGTCEFLSFTL